MKILFAIQGTGNGHISRAREIIPLLQQHGEVDLLISGTQADVLPDQPLNYQYHGFSFIFGEKGGVDHWKTYKTMNLPRLWKDVRALPLDQYNLIINDYEPVSAWACRLQNKQCIALSHQSSFLSQQTPRPQNRSAYTEWLFKYYAPSNHQVGFHFDKYADYIHTPVIRSEIRSTESKDNGHVTVYLPAYSDQTLLKFLKKIPEVKFEVFSKRSRIPYSDTNVFVQPVSNKKFNTSLANCHGLLTGGGFEGPAEALFLGKKVIMMPMKFQYEQECNAEAAKKMNVPVIYQLDENFVPKVKNWIHSTEKIAVNFPDETEDIINKLVKQFAVA